ncbi:VOC family protein [Butyrivibrio sp. AC2005]|uniref:VOC family protein n=1 Tax=Butyrivibrio sp. AC2005 TaxID=1280672 RepID=UPI000407B8F0|nr:VOC family protein [Butyrivibrio sp. AC2005]
MKITGFCPLIVTKDPEAVMKIFEDLGFEKKHTKTDIEGGDNTNYAMKDANGNRINIASSETIPQDITSMSINVDNFQEAYDFLIAHGFVNPRGDKVTDTSSSRATMLFAPSGFPVTISEHIKKD